MKIKFVIAALLAIFSCAALAQQTDVKPEDPFKKPAPQKEKTETVQKTTKPDKVVRLRPTQNAVDVLQNLQLAGDPFTFVDDQNGQSVVVNWTDMHSADMDKKVSLDCNDMPIREALKMLFDQVKVPFEVEKDVPDTRITVKMNNVHFHTALSALTEAAGVGWQQQYTVKDKKASSSFKIGKNLKSNFSVGNLLNGQHGSIYSWTGDTLKGNPRVITPQNNAPFFNGAKPLTVTPGVNGLYNMLSTEERHTFTCPHCGQQVTIISKRQAPTCEKCGRAFQSGWKFCPFDGAKRPNEPDKWQFCPHCGKQVTP